MKNIQNALLKDEIFFNMVSSYDTSDDGKININSKSEINIMLVAFLC